MARKASDQIADGQPCCAPPASGRDDEIRAAALLAIRHLQLHNCGKFFRCHIRARQHSRPLHMGGRRNNNNAIAALPPAFFKKQRHIQNHKSMAAMFIQKTPLFRMDHRVHQALEFFQRNRIVEYGLPEFDAIQTLCIDSAGK